MKKFFAILLAWLFLLVSCQTMTPEQKTNIADLVGKTIAVMIAHYGNAQTIYSTRGQTYQKYVYPEDGFEAIAKDGFIIEVNELPQ